MSEKKSPIFKMSIDTKLIYDRLSKAAINEIITYKELSEIIGRNIQGSARFALVSACRKLFNDSNMNFDTIPKVGVKLLDDKDRVHKGASYIGKISRQSKRGIKSVMSVQNYEALPGDIKLLHQCSMTVMRLSEAATKSRSVKMIQEKVAEQSCKILPLSETLKAFEK